MIWILFKRVDVCILIVKGLIYLYLGYDFFIIYCDLKFLNIFLDGDLEVYVVDLGIVWMLGVNLNIGGNIFFGLVFGGIIGYMVLGIFLLIFFAMIIKFVE